MNSLWHALGRQHLVMAIMLGLVAAGCERIGKPQGDLGQFVASMRQPVEPVASQSQAATMALYEGRVPDHRYDAAGLPSPFAWRSSNAMSGASALSVAAQLTDAMRASTKTPIRMAGAIATKGSRWHIFEDATGYLYLVSAEGSAGVHCQQAAAAHSPSSQPCVTAR